MFDLTGRTALISGATRGLGRAFAQGLAQAGARVIINGRGAEQAERVADEFCTQGYDALALPFDVTDEAAVTAAFASLDAAGIELDVLINNPDFDNWVKASNPSGRWGQPQELMGTAVYLASRASDYVNGQIIYVDGGWLAML